MNNLIFSVLTVSCRRLLFIFCFVTCYGCNHAEKPADTSGEPAATETEQEVIADSTGSTATAIIYTCPMHPEVKQNEPGKCPKCNMDLEVKK